MADLQSGHLTITPGGSGSPTSGTGGSSTPTFTQLEGTNPHSDIKTMFSPQKTEKRDDKGSPNSDLSSNCQGASNCGATAPPNAMQIFASLDHSRLAQEAIDQKNLDYYNQTHYDDSKDLEYMKGDHNIVKKLGLYAKMRFIQFLYIPANTKYNSDLAYYLQTHPADDVNNPGLKEAAQTQVVLDGMAYGSLGGAPEGAMGSGILRGEPVAVASGEYLESWKDFCIPADVPLDGTRYMGLKLPQPMGYTAPLGHCQISMFDEVFSNPERNRLEFFQADGKRIAFNRPLIFFRQRMIPVLTLICVRLG